MTVVGFVCSGNICRSPMAEYLARSTATGNADDVEFVSAGILASVGQAPSAGAIMVMGDAGIVIEHHRAADVWEIGPGVDRIYALSREHLTAMREAWPDRVDAIQMLRRDGRSIEDPWGLGEKAYLKARDQIAEAVAARAAAGWR